MSDCALRIAHVSHAFGKRRALEDVSLEVAQGEFVALLGLNGAGKTTLFSLVTRLYDNVSGEIAIFGHDVRRKPSSALARLGVVFQAKTLDPDLTVAQNLAYHAGLQGLSRADGRRRAELLLARVGLSDRRNEVTRRLSGGQARRVEIARALLHDPRLLILDEATVGLDVAARAEIIGLVRGLVRDEGLGVLWATHLFDEIGEHDSIVLLHLGHVVASGLCGDIVARAGCATLAEAFARLTAKVEETA